VRRGAHDIRFVLNGEVVTVCDAAPTTTLLDYLRETLGHSGTKEGCAEGDCGACTVVVGEIDGGRIDYRAINSCIRFLPTVDGKAVVTVEGLRGADGTLHPVQRALVEHHASQCGFCTPGFVMSLFALYLGNPRPDREQVVSALSGNLCRCTGYRPIIEAGCRMHDYPEPDTWSRSDAQCGERVNVLRSIQSDDVTPDLGNGYGAPRQLDALAQLYQAHPDSLLLAGGTDIGLWVTKHKRELPPLIYIGDVPELKRIRCSDDALEIGAAVRLEEAYGAIVARYPMLYELAERFASRPIRNSGTLCGNVANGSPIGDSMPILIALGASVELRCGRQYRSLALENLYLGYQKNALAPGEFVTAVRVPLLSREHRVASYKVSKRYDQDISAVCAGYAVELRNDTIVSARIAYGGMAAIPQRARRVEAALVGNTWSLATIERARSAIAEDFAPLDDMRASRDYRLRVAANLLRRFYLEHDDAVAWSRLSEVAHEP
jgi:xanthine dehydrogenase small subunit